MPPPSRGWRRSFSPSPSRNSPAAPANSHRRAARRRLARGSQNRRVRRQKFREAGLDTRIDVYKVWLNLPGEILVEATAPAGLKMRGPTREHVEGDPYQDDPRVVTPFNSGSPSGEVEAEVVYANYARPEDFRTLKQMGIDVRGKVVIARYGQNFRGVKALAAQENGAAALILYSDPIRRRILPWRPLSRRTLSPRHRRAARLGPVHLRVSRRPHHPRLCLHPRSSQSQRRAPQNAAVSPKFR